VPLCNASRARRFPKRRWIEYRRRRYECASWMDCLRSRRSKPTRLFPYARRMKPCPALNLGLGRLYHPLSATGLELIRCNFAVVVAINHLKVDDVRDGLILRDIVAPFGDAMFSNALMLRASLVQHVGPSKPIISTGPRARTCDRPGRCVNNAERRVCWALADGPKPFPPLRCHFGRHGGAVCHSCYLNSYLYKPRPLFILK
jgi:hypothetical protein